MEQDVITRLTDAIRTFNARADHARAGGLRVALEDVRTGEPRHCCLSHLDILRCAPLGADLEAERQHEECVAEIALLSATEEVNRLVDEARRRNVAFSLRLVTDAKTHEHRVELVMPSL